MVTRDPLGQRLAARYGARVLVEEENRGHTAASSLGARTLRQERIGGMVQVPADIPLLTPDDVQALLRVHGQAPAVTLSPSRDERGTNAVVCSPPDLLPLRFGDDSFSAHLRLAAPSASSRRSCAAPLSRSTSTRPLTWQRSCGAVKHAPGHIWRERHRRTTSRPATLAKLVGRKGSGPAHLRCCPSGTGRLPSVRTERRGAVPRHQKPRRQALARSIETGTGRHTVLHTGECCCV